MEGRVLSHYRVNEPLGGGGMGVIYSAEDTHLKRSVALKFLTPELTRDAEARERFVQEAQAASALHVVLTGGHYIGQQRSHVVREVLNWLDRYLGPVELQVRLLSNPDAGSAVVSSSMCCSVYC